MDTVSQNGGIFTNKEMEAIVQKLIGSNVFRVIDVKFGDTTSEVSGFMATHSRAVVTVKHQGEEQTFNFFIKSSPKQESQKEFGREFGVFETEIGFYTQIIPQITELGVTLPYATCYLTRTGSDNEFLIMEDLVQSGYKLADRKKGLDFDHCCLVVTELAKLHAGSVALEQKIGRPLGEEYSFLKYIFFNPDYPKSVKVMEQSLKTVLVLAKQFLPHVKDLVPLYESRMLNLQSECRKLEELWPVLNVVCHGDLWINNLLFAYEGSRPLSVRLLDLQLGKYGAPSLDIIVFLWVSTLRCFRKENERILIQKYYDSFTQTATKLNIKPPESFTFDSLWKHYKARILLGAVYKIFYLPIIMMDSEDISSVVDPNKPDEFGDVFLNDTQTKNTCDLFQRNENFRFRMTEAIEELFDALKS